MDPAQAGLVNVCVDLRGLGVAVAQQFLDDAQIGAAAEQVGREAVPQRVRRDVLEDAAPTAVFFDEHPEADALHRLAGARQKEPFASADALKLPAALAEISRD